MQDGILRFLKDRIYFVLGGLCLVVVGVVYVVSRSRAVPVRVVAPQDMVYSHGQVLTTAPGTEVVYTTLPPTLVVHITGEVANPGVFELPYGARVNDALYLAGGATEDANLSAVNLAAFVRDAMQIVIPAFGQVVDGALVEDMNPPGGIVDGLVNINTATLLELQTLPGVGPVLAQNIIDFREAGGGFTSIEELIHVNRIGTATLERLRPLVRI